MVSPKAGYFFMNRSAIDEDEGSEVLKVFELEKSSLEMTGAFPEFNTFEELESLQLKLMQERREKGIGLFIFKKCLFASNSQIKLFIYSL